MAKEQQGRSYPQDGQPWPEHTPDLDVQDGAPWPPPPLTSGPVGPQRRSRLGPILVWMLVLTGVIALLAILLSVSSDADESNYAGDSARPFDIGEPTVLDWQALEDSDTTGRGNAVWNVTVGPLMDITEDDGAFEYPPEPPEENIRYVAFEVELTLVQPGTEGLNNVRNIAEDASQFQWRIVGGDSGKSIGWSTLTDRGCETRDALGRFNTIYPGATVDGTVCIPITADDLESAETQIAITKSRFGFHFSPDGQSLPPVEVPPLDEIWEIADDASNRSYSLTSFDDPVSLDIPGAADSTDGSSWTLTVGKPVDVTSELPRSDDYPPPPGHIYVAMDVTLRLDSATNEPISTSEAGIRFQIVGGATGVAYAGGCPSNEGFNRSQQTFADGVISGPTCIVIPSVDLDHPNTRVAVAFFDFSSLYQNFSFFN